MSGVKKYPTCNCAQAFVPNGKALVLNGIASIGFATEFWDNGVYKNSERIHVVNNYCPQCGAKYVTDGEQMTMFDGSGWDNGAT